VEDAQRGARRGSAARASRILLRQFAGIGIGPGLDPDAQPKVVRESLVRAAGAGMQLLKRQFVSGEWATVVHGWRYPPPSEGRAGDDFLLRAADQSLAGIVANAPAEAVYLVNMADADGNAFAGSARYELRFTGADLPPVDSFWSLTMHKADMNLVPNSAERYSIGDRTPGVARESDGGLTIRLQAESPGTADEANRLPCPTDGTWFVILRLYRPHDEVIAADWKCPPIRRVGRHGETRPRPAQACGRRRGRRRPGQAPPKPSAGSRPASSADLSAVAEHEVPHARHRPS
jgi:hypothetical protein